MPAETSKEMHDGLALVSLHTGLADVRRSRLKLSTLKLSVIAHNNRQRIMGERGLILFNDSPQAMNHCSEYLISVHRFQRS